MVASLDTLKFFVVTELWRLQRNRVVCFKRAYEPMVRMCYKRYQYQLQMPCRLQSGSFLFFSTFPLQKLAAVYKTTSRHFHLLSISYWHTYILSAFFLLVCCIVAQTLDLLTLIPLVLRSCLLYSIIIHSFSSSFSNMRSRTPSRSKTPSSEQHNLFKTHLREERTEEPSYRPSDGDNRRRVVLDGLHFPNTHHLHSSTAHSNPISTTHRSLTHAAPPVRCTNLWSWYLRNVIP